MTDLCMELTLYLVGGSEIKCVLNSDNDIFESIKFSEFPKNTLLIDSIVPGYRCDGNFQQKTIRIKDPNVNIIAVSKRKIPVTYPMPLMPG